MSNEDELKNYESWEFAHTYKKSELIKKLKTFVSDLEKNKLKISTEEAKEKFHDPLEIDFISDEILGTFEYDLEPMFLDENEKKGYFAIKFFWSSLGIDKLIEDEEQFDDMEVYEDDDDSEDF